MVNIQSPRILVRRSGPLSGSVHVPGAKNSVLKLMAATLLAEGDYVLTNVPAITDVHTMADTLASLEEDKRERFRSLVQTVKDTQLERAVDMLKGIQIYGQRKKQGPVVTK